MTPQTKANGHCHRTSSGERTLSQAGFWSEDGPLSSPSVRIYTSLVFSAETTNSSPSLHAWAVQGSVPYWHRRRDKGREKRHDCFQAGRTAHQQPSDSRNGTTSAQLGSRACVLIVSFRRTASPALSLLLGQPSAKTPPACCSAVATCTFSGRVTMVCAVLMRNSG